MIDASLKPARSPIHDLARSGRLAGAEGNQVARETRAPQLRDALRFAGCADTADPDAFYQRDREAGAAWRRRRAVAIRKYCAPCPVRAACGELALRAGDSHGVHGGLTEAVLAARLRTQERRLAQARIADAHVEGERAERIQAALAVRVLAAKNTKDRNRRRLQAAAVREAKARRAALLAAFRAGNGWATA